MPAADTQPALAHPPYVAATRPYRRWRSTGFSSKRFGPCEVCGEHCAEVWIGSVGNDSTFGHEACVAKAVA